MASTRNKLLGFLGAEVALFGLASLAHRGILVTAHSGGLRRRLGIARHPRAEGRRQH
ncbi:MAG: hypothetical protein ACJ8R9_31085 [Steroidobacteraceae bacterium]